MIIQKINPSQLEKAYNIRCQGLYPLKREHFFAPFGSAYCEVEPQGFSARHNHHENETFYILQGSGTMEINGEKENVSAGDVILIPALSHHRLDNTSTTERLNFVSVYWSAPLVPEIPKHLLVIPAPPTPNGPLHLGHLSGPYFAADVYTRYATSRGSNAFYAMGTDDNQCYVAAKGRLLGLTGEEVVDKFTPLITSALEDFGCNVTTFLHPLGQGDYTRFVQETFVTLMERGVIELRTVPTPFCEATQQFLYGAQVTGKCPTCKQLTSGQSCEACGAYNDAWDLIEPKSNVGKGPVVLKDAEKYYFPLSKYADKLRTILAQVSMHPKLRAFYDAYLDRGLPDVAVTQFGEWGVPCPLMDGQVLYEWFEMAGSYFHLSDQVCETKGEPAFWQDKLAGVVECFGFDNSFFYGLLVPALMSEIDPSSHPPKAFLFNFFYNLDGKKFSTSRGHAVWAHEILATVPPDAIRFYLAKTRPEDIETNFNLNEMTAFVERELVGRWEPFLAAVTTGTVPAFTDSLAWDHERFLSRVNRIVEEIHQHYNVDRFSLNAAAEGLIELFNTVSLFHARFDALDPRARNLTAQALRAWATLLTPLMPEFGAKVAKAMSASGKATLITELRTDSSIDELPKRDLSDALAKLKAFTHG